MRSSFSTWSKSWSAQKTQTCSQNSDSSGRYSDQSFRRRGRSFMTHSEAMIFSKYGDMLINCVSSTKSDQISGLCLQKLETMYVCAVKKISDQISSTSTTAMPSQNGVTASFASSPNFLVQRVFAFGQVEEWGEVGNALQMHRSNLCRSQLE